MYGCQKLLDPVVICPYDEKHLIFKSRLQKHIVKCEKVIDVDRISRKPQFVFNSMERSNLSVYLLACVYKSREFFATELSRALQSHVPLQCHSSLI